ncbi:MAG: hypothetical protein JNK60_22985, partial [Acidobacteria bacterium]|nr:hypothetical protein [Acidobacteriota bacterium]
LAAGLFTQGYYAFVAFLGVLGVAFFSHPGRPSPGRGRRPSRKPVLVAVGVAALCLLPLGVFALKRPAAFLERPSTTSLHRHVPKESLVRAYATNFRATALMFHLQGDVNPRHNVPDRPLLTSGEAALLTLGLGALLAGLRGFRSRVVLAWLVLMLLPGALSFEAPQAYRTFGAMPGVFLAIGCGLDLALGVSGTLRRVVLAAFAGFALAVSLENVVTYFGVQTRGPLVAREFEATYTASARFVASVPPDALVLVDYAVARPEELLLATHRRAQPSTVIPFSEGLHVPPGRDLLNEEAPELVYVLRPSFEKLAAPLARLSSLARVERHHGPDGALAFVTVRLPLPLTSPVPEPPGPRPHPRS